MTVPIKFSLHPAFFAADGMCRICPPYPAQMRLDHLEKRRGGAVGASAKDAAMLSEMLSHPEFCSALGSGYIIPAPFDMEVDVVQEGDQFLVHQQVPEDIPAESAEVWKPFENGHGARQVAGSPWGDADALLKLKGFWHVETPPGYSCLFASPALFSGENVPLYALPGIVETDRYKDFINFPSVAFDEFPLSIKEGTPLVHVIPFQRTDWKSEFGRFSDDAGGRTDENGAT